MTAPFGWYGDDFTGATDTLSTLARAGLEALLFLRIPTAAQLVRAGRLDAVGIAGAARAMAPEAMRAELEPVGRFFAELGVRILQYKCCSTFDSAPKVGNLATAIETLRPRFPNPLVPIIGGQPNLGRYCLFGNLFAAAGTGGEVFRIDRHPTMRNHPVTPMQEADLRRHLALQGMLPPALMTYPHYALPGLPDRVQALLTEALDTVLFDVARDEDLAAIGPLLWSHAAKAPMLTVGPSSVGQALAHDWPGTRRGTEDKPLAAASGPVFVMVGSLSPVTRRQMELASDYQHVIGDPVQMIADEAYAGMLASRVAEGLQAGRHMLAATAAPTGAPLPADAVARATADLLRRVVSLCPVRRLGIAGGDTSSLGTQALDLWGLSYAGLLAPGVTLCRAHSDDPALDGMELMLKGGQMGPPELFSMLTA